MSTKSQPVSSAIQWHDGMILGPQHFQEAFFRTENLLQSYSKELVPFGYGFTQFQIDDGAFASGVLRILQAQGIMPDGLEFSFDPQKDSLLTIELKTYDDDLSKRDLTLYLAIPVSGTTHNISMDELSRFKESRAEAAYDQNVGGEELDIPRIRPRLKLFLGDLPPAHHVSLPMAKCFKEGTLYRFRPYVPPVLRIEKQSLIYEECLLTSVKIRQKIQMVLEDLQRMKTLSQQQYIFDKYFTIHALAIGLPRFEAVFKSEAVNPFMIHLELSSLLGGIYSIDQDTSPPVSVEYNHLEILQSFLKSLIVKFLQTSKSPHSLRWLRILN